ncbi:hypothetical protein DFP72DRAFT_1172338 [Ephemerocybe angulata]|uniref:Uncharacterized protein n=1 Tax=Ephemerocybe angulata TaxID=980116 RepID=A0A8H6HRX3_9AGAR|nr:hypothetical protein DFP72DRAFT_1172338 [Tulosesus angulatus]
MLHAGSRRGRGSFVVVGVLARASRVVQAGRRRRRAPGSVAGLVLVVVCGGEATPLSSGRSPDMRVIDRGESRYVCLSPSPVWFCAHGFVQPGFAVVVEIPPFSRMITFAVRALAVQDRCVGPYLGCCDVVQRMAGTCAGGGEDHELVAAVGVGPGRRSRISAQGCRRCCSASSLGLSTSSCTWTRLLAFGYVVVVVVCGCCVSRAISLGSVVGHGYLFRIVVDVIGVVHPIRKSRAHFACLLNENRAAH